MAVPFVALDRQYESLKPEIDAAIQAVLDSTAFVRGPFVDRFERAYEEAYGVRHCITVANGTDALTIALRALGVGPGDEVITAANSWISTSEAVSLVGATPVFVDVEEETFTLDPTLVEAEITPKTRAVIPVHLYGQPADMHAIRVIAERYDLRVVEDCAQAHFAEYGERRVGTFGDLGAFSFYPSKNLGAYGDGGALVTDDDRLAEWIRKYVNHGGVEKNIHEMEGLNSRLDGLQAAVLSVKLPRVGHWSSKRRALAAEYDAKLSSLAEIVTPKVRKGATHVFHLYVIRAERRDRLRRYLAENGVDTGIHYPTPLPLLPAYRHLAYDRLAIPTALGHQSEILSLPMCAEMTSQQIDEVCGCIHDFYETDPCAD